MQFWTDHTLQFVFSVVCYCDCLVCKLRVTWFLSFFFSALLNGPKSASCYAVASYLQKCVRCAETQSCFFFFINLIETFEIEVETCQSGKIDVRDFFLDMFYVYVFMHMVDVRPSVRICASTVFMHIPPRVCVHVKRVCVCRGPCASPLYNEIMRVSEAGEAQAGHPTDRN